MNSNDAVGVRVIYHMINDLTRRGNLSTDTSTAMKDAGTRHYLQAKEDTKPAGTLHLDICIQDCEDLNVPGALWWELWQTDMDMCRCLPKTRPMILS